MKTLILFALDEEARPFLRRVRDRENLVVRVSGMGPENARRTIQTLLSTGSPPSRVLTCGYAGALHPDLRIGDIVWHSENDPELHGRLKTLGAFEARFCCSERVAVTAVDKACLRRKLGADAVEMESGIIHQVCLRQAIPCTTVRAVSDTAQEDLPFDFSKFARPDQSIDIPRLLVALAGSPGKLGPLLRLRRHCIRAADRLAAALLQLI